MKSGANLTTILVFTASISLFSGCAAFRASVDVEDPKKASIMTAHFDQHDLLDLADLIAADVLNHPFPQQGEKTPIVAVLGIQNRTKSHLDMKALADTISMKLLDSGRMLFVNTARRDDLLKEQGYQLANCTEETKVSIGKQLGAKYMVTGSFVEIGARSAKQVRVSKKEDVYFQLTLEVTDLETGLIVLRKQQDRLRRASKPIIGW